MSRRIVIYRHGDRSASGFETPESLCRYLEGGIFSEEGGRYRYTQMKMADVIVLARGGSAFGHFEIDEAVAPTLADRQEYPPVKKDLFGAQTCSVRRAGAPIRARSFKIPFWLGYPPIRHSERLACAIKGK